MSESIDSKPTYRPRRSDQAWLDAVKRHVGWVKRITRDYGSLPADWRLRLTSIVRGDLGSCPHTVCSIFQIQNAHGVWGVEICDNCGKLTARECPHVHMTWYEDGQALICSNCGIDGT